MELVPEVPPEWQVATSSQIDVAKTFALTALTDAGPWPVSGRLERYYNLRGNYAGATFTTLQDRHPSSMDPRRMAVADLHAVSLLSVRVPPAATRALIENLDGHASQVNTALAALHDLGQRHLRDADADVFRAMEHVVGALKAACANQHAQVSNPWVLVSKLAARKAPDLFPVRDNVVCTALGLLGRGKARGSYRIDWQVYQQLFLDHDVRAAIIAAQDTVNSRDRAEYGPEQSELRVLDAALWTYEIRRMDDAKRAERTSATGR